MSTPAVHCAKPQRRAGADSPLVSSRSSSPREPEVKVWVTSEGKALPVFRKQTGNPASVSAEITGLEGKEFQVSRTRIRRIVHARRSAEDLFSASPGTLL